MICIDARPLCRGAGPRLGSTNVNDDLPEIKPVRTTQPARTPHALQAIPDGDLERIYSDLRRHAHTLLVGERRGHTLEATALVHEALGKLLTELGGAPPALPPASETAERRRMLFSMISLRMRQVLVEHARHRNALKGPGRWTRSPLNDAIATVERQGLDLVELDRALAELHEIDEEAAITFQHRWFGGLSMEQIATVLEISTTEAQLRWNRARKFMKVILRSEQPTTSGESPREEAE